MDVLLDHIVLNVRDISTSLHFYTNILQFEPERATLRQRLIAAEAVFHRDMSRNRGAKGSGISMYFFDPDGNEIEARYYEGEKPPA